ncbi:MAG TPA: hypothetical protein PKL77_00230 [Candidatus Omnitrophota bacterium]|nr:hypothetical protein [Candidatus Omnitrophota bacterium]HPT06652.1 hypothetical protein [Candidatus Omnitrophota bacterium]
MKSRNVVSLFVGVAGLCGMILGQAGIACAEPRMGGPRDHHDYYVESHHAHYYYRDGRLYRPGWFGLFEIAVNVPPIGAVVSILPSGYRTVVVGGNPYYYYENVYYATCPQGYVVVPQPVIVQTPVPAVAVTPEVVTQSAGSFVTINVPNANGSFIPVTLVKRGDGYVGPQGEYYSGHPTVEQLKVLYGK